MLHLPITPKTSGDAADFEANVSIPSSVSFVAAFFSQRYLNDFLANYSCILNLNILKFLIHSYMYIYVL